MNLSTSFEAIKALYKEGKLHEAKSKLQSLLNEDETNVEGWHYLGLILFELSEFDQAILSIQKAMLLAPEDVTHYLHLANILKAQKKYDEAILIINQGLAYDATFAAFYNNLGSIYFLQKKWQAAANAFLTAIELQANYIDAYYHLGLTYNKLNEFEKAYLAFLAVNHLASEHPGALFQLGCLAMQKKEYEGAIQFFTKIINKHPFHVESLINLGTCYFKLGIFNQAKKHYIQALEINADDSQVLFNLAIINMHEGKILDAISYYQTLLMSNPDHFGAHNNIAIIYHLLKDDKNAKTHLKAAIKLAPDNVSVRHFLNVINHTSQDKFSPSEYITSLFDSYADHYDNHMVQALNYQTPQLFLKMVKDELVKTKSTSKHFDVLDLGCGTGLCGILFKPLAHQLIGIDLSQNMLTEAAKKHCYTALINENILTFLPHQPKNSFDLVIAADVLVYMGELNLIFEHVYAVLRPEGYFIFNCEVSEKEKYLMGLSGRFQHHAAYLAKCIKNSHFEMITYQMTTIRTSDQEEVLGHLYLVQKLH